MTRLFLDLLIWAVVGAIFAWVLRGRLPTRKYRLVQICIAYAMSLGMFAHVYAYLYLANHESFAFASDVVRTRRQSIAIDKSNQLEQQKALLTAVSNLLDELTSRASGLHFARADDDFIELETKTNHYD